MKRLLCLLIGIFACVVGQIGIATAQANINPNIYPGGGTTAHSDGPWEWHAAPGPRKRGNMCITHVDPARGYGFQAPCPAPKAAAAPGKSIPKKSATKRRHVR
jgi:hypothetical protein